MIVPNLKKPTFLYLMKNIEKVKENYKPVDGFANKYETRF